MAKAVSQASMHPSRLVRCMDDLSLLKREPDATSFVDQLSRMMDLSNSLKLVEGLGAVKGNTTDGEAGARPIDAIKADCIDVRTEIIETVVKSFVPDVGSLSFNLPLTESQGLSDEEATMAGWQRFYALHQSDMELKLNKLRATVRQDIAGFSDGLAQLTALDKLMQDSMADQARKRFATLVKTLPTRFKVVQAQYQDEQAQLQQIHNDMQALLLAELDVRMQPILGLVEAYEEEIGLL